MSKIYEHLKPWVKAAAYAWLLLFIAPAVYKAVRADIASHNATMREIAIEAKEEARWLFLRECVRKNSAKVCEAAK